MNVTLTVLILASLRASITASIAATFGVTECAEDEYFAREVCALGGDHTSATSHYICNVALTAEQYEQLAPLEEVEGVLVQQDLIGSSARDAWLASQALMLKPVPPEEF